jgi:nucleotide-binding universal stress UspA family protein
MSEAMESQHRIVVGVDGSPGADAALAWAIAEAHLREARVDAVHALHLPQVVYVPFAPMVKVPIKELEAAAHQIVAEAARRAGDHPHVEVTSTVVEGHATTVLLAAARGADLLVVGTRGHGGFAGLLLGSTSQACSHHSPCPVVIVPPPPAQDQG